VTKTRAGLLLAALYVGTIVAVAVRWAEQVEAERDDAIAHAEHVEAALAATEDHIQAVREAIDPDKLDLLADYFDVADAFKDGRGVEVQADLHRWAKTIRALSAEEAL
jgi:hypothetical protein